MRQDTGIRHMQIGTAASRIDGILDVRESKIRLTIRNKTMPDEQVEEITLTIVKDFLRQLREHRDENRPDGKDGRWVPYKGIAAAQVETA